MRMLGFTKKNSGTVVNGKVSHEWVWWKDEKGTVYMGDPTSGVGFDGEDNDNGYGAFLWDEFTLSKADQLDYFGYSDLDEMRAALTWEERLVPFSTYSKYCPIKGFAIDTKTKSAWIKYVKGGDDLYAAKGENGTNWKLREVDFSNYQEWV